MRVLNRGTEHLKNFLVSLKKKFLLASNKYKAYKPLFKEKETIIMLTKANQIEYMKEKAEKIVNSYSLSAGAVGAIPIPFADAPILLVQQTSMLSEINDIFGLKSNDSALKRLIMTVIELGGASMLGKTIVKNLLKMIPVAGSFVGGTVSAVTAATITYSMGMLYIEFCKDVVKGQKDENFLFTAEGREIFKTRLYTEYDI